MKNNYNYIAKYSTNSNTSNLEKIRDFVFNNAIEFGFNEDEAQKLVTAVDEACTNLIRHAFEYDISQCIDLEVGNDDNTFIVKIIDCAPPFDPRKVENPNLKEYREEIHKGGLGIYIMKCYVDDVDYKISKNGKHENILTLKKELG